MKKIETVRNPFVVADSVSYSPDSIVSRQLTNSQNGNITLFAFDGGQQLSEHTAPFDAAVQIIDGRAEIRVGGETFHVKTGEMLVMPANIPHALYAETPFKMLLVMIKG